jgi:ABC-2 type transport system ATP-binding protein
VALMNTPDTYVIQTHGLSKTFKGVQALKGLDLKVPKHSIFGFLGPNGAGKSTTIKLLLGLTRPTAGKAMVFGQEIAADSVAIRQRIGYLAQDPRYYEDLTARQTLRFTAGFFYSGPRAAIEERIEQTLELVGLDDKSDRPIKGFSGGERQRLGLAQAQVNYPDLLILDEPAASLDPMGRRDVLEVMERLRKHTTIFYSTHILEDVQRVSDTVAILKGGELVAEAPIDQLLAGSGGASYALALKGDVDGARARIVAQPWVTAVSVGARNGSTHLDVAVSDESAADNQLLKLVLSEPGVTVAEFGRKKHNLEEVFMGLVEGDSGRGR